MTIFGRILVFVNLVFSLLVGFLLLLVAGPFFLIVGVLLGFIVSFFLTYKLAMGELAD